VNGKREIRHPRILAGGNRPFTVYRLPFTLLLRLLGIPGRQSDSIGELAVQTDLEGVLAGAGKWDVEHQHGTGFHVDHPGGRLTELHRPLTAQEFAAAIVDETDPDGVDADLGAPAPDPKHQVGAGIHRREVREPHVLEHAQHAQLTLLIDEGVVGNDGEIEMQLRKPVWM
jgi:hypothetical protein